MFAKLHLLSQDAPEGGGGLRRRAHPYLRMAGAVPKGPAVFDWSERQREDLEALWRDPTAEGARERLAGDLAAFCDKLGWTPDVEMLEDAEAHGDEYLVTLSAVPPELYLLPWEVIQVGASGTYLSDYASAQVRYAMPGLEPREIMDAPPEPGVLFAWSGAGGAVPHEEQATAIRAAAEAGGVTFRELAEVDEASLQAALDAGSPSVLHLLCHGLPGPEGEPPRLRWGASDSPSEITATRLARMLRRHHGTIRLVVLSACGSGDGRGDPLFLCSMAQELHRKGIPNVVASRYPLSVRGARVMTRALYDKLLREAWSLERALRHTRQALLRADDDGESHPGDAYGIQLYAYDTEQFVSDNNVLAERPVLASYPFGTAARPVPASGPPAAELTLSLEADPGLSEDQLADKLRRVSEDESLTVARSRAGKRAVSLLVRTTVDGAQRLLGAWRSKVMQAVVGVIVGELILTKGIASALAGNLSAVVGKAVAAPGQGAASAGQVGTAAGQTATAATGKATAVAIGKATAAVAGKMVAAKLVLVAVIGSAAVGGGVAVYRAQSRSSASDALVVENQRANAAPPALGPPALGPPALGPPALGPPALGPPVWGPPALDPPALAPPDAGPPDAASSPPAVVTGPALLHVTPVLTLKQGELATFYQSENYGHGRPVGFIVPQQDTASGPTLLVSGSKPGAAKLTVVARAQSTGKEQQLTLKGSRSSHCEKVPMNVMNGSASCRGGEQSILILTIAEGDNVTVPAGAYAGSLRIDAKEGNGRPLVKALSFDYQVTIEHEDAGVPAGSGGPEPPNAGTGEHEPPQGRTDH